MKRWQRTVFLVGALTLHGCVAFVPTEPPPIEQSIEITDVPFFPQDRYQCGPAALATALGAGGVSVSPRSLVDDVYVPGRGGSLQAEMQAAVRRRGRLPFPVAAEEAALGAELAAGHPVLILQNLGLNSLPRWHYAVVVGYDARQEQWILRSGKQRRRLESARQFRRHWMRAQRWGLVVLRPGELPVVSDPATVATTLAETEASLSPDAAFLAWDRAAGRWPGHADLSFGAANAARAAGHPARAAAGYQSVLALAPHHLAARNNFADLLLTRDCHKQAREVLAPALATLTSDNPLAPLLSATAREAAGKGTGSCRLPQVAQ